MEIILNNPYRVTGLLVGATAREQDRQIKRLKTFIDAGHEPPQDDYSFPFLGTLDRRLEAVTSAASRLNLDNDRLNAALFWFYDGYPITDEPALEALKDFDISEAVNIWTRMIAAGEVTKRNCSAFQNLSTFLLCQSIADNNCIDEATLEQGIRMKLQFLDSDFAIELKLKATDETFEITKLEIQLAFLNILQRELERNVYITPIKWISLLSKCDFSAKEVYLSSFIQIVTDPIEKKIEAAGEKRAANNANAAEAGKKIYHSVVDDLKEMQSALGVNHIKYALIADKAAEEILQCGIDYFNYCKNQDYTDDIFAAVSMDLLKKAQSLAVGTLVKKQCEDNIDGLQEWINSKPARDRQAKAAIDLKKLKFLIEEYDKKDQTVENAKQFLWGTNIHLLNCKIILGKNDPLYLAISTKIASDAQEMYISEINELQVNASNSFDKTQAMRLLQSEITEAWKIINSIETMDLEPDFRHDFDENKASFVNLMIQVSKANANSNVNIKIKNNSDKSINTVIRKIFYPFVNV